MRRSRDILTGDLFEVPVPMHPAPGALDIGTQLRGLVSTLLKDSPLDRFEVAAAMSRLLGREITKHMLDSWTAESREGWRFPLEFLPAFEEALQTHALTAWIADLRGCRLLVGREALDAEIGKLERLRDEAAKKIKQLKSAMGDAA